MVVISIGHHGKSRATQRSSHLFSTKSRRLFTALLLLFGGYCAQSMRSHIGVSMVCMVNATAVHEISAKNYPLRAEVRKHEHLEPRCKPLETIQRDRKSEGYSGTFVWTTNQQSLIFQSSFYGNFITMWFAGLFVDHFGPKIVALIAVSGMTLTIFASPSMAFFDFYGFVALRIVFGIFEYTFYPTMAAMAARWFTASEKSTISAIITSGNQLATSLGIVIASELCTVDLLNGWPLIFYLAGILGVIWLIVWSVWATDSPSDSKFLSSTEKEFLHEEIGKHLHSPQERKRIGQKLPLREMLTSKAIIAILIAEFAFNFANTLMQVYLPTYFRDVLALDMKRNGLFTALPFIAQLVSKIVLGIFADFLKHKKILSPSAACRIFQAAASFSAAAIFIGIAFYVDCTEHGLALLLLSAYGIATGATICGSFTASLCVAPMFSGTVSALVMISGAFANILAPAAVGVLVKEGTKVEWSIVFGMTAVVYCLGGAVFLVYGTAKIQRWAIPKQQPPPIMLTQCSVDVFSLEGPGDSINHLRVK